MMLFGHWFTFIAQVIKKWPGEQRYQCVVCLREEMTHVKNDLVCTLAIRRMRATFIWLANEQTRRNALKRMRIVFSTIGGNCGHA